MSGSKPPARYSGPLAEPKLLFSDFALRSVTEGAARERFQLLVTDLVRLEHPTADTVRGPGGRDWGIDTYVGSFDGAICVWQSKFFLNGIGDTQRGEIRASFDQVIQKAKENDITLDAWCLCVPFEMSPEERKWFDGWAGRQERKHGIVITAWTGTELRSRLMRADASDVTAHYFGGAIEHGRVEGLAMSDDLSTFDDALFVRQLSEAGQVETDAARGLFFAADALFRDLAARGDENAIEAMNEMHLEVHRIGSRISTGPSRQRMRKGGWLASSIRSWTMLRPCRIHTASGCVRHTVAASPTASSRTHMPDG